MTFLVTQKKSGKAAARTMTPNRPGSVKRAPTCAVRVLTVLVGIVIYGATEVGRGLVCDL